MSARECHADVAKSSIHVTVGDRGRGIGKAFIRHQATAADDADLWTLQTAIFAENRASIALHPPPATAPVGIRERIAYSTAPGHDTVLLERRTNIVSRPRLVTGSHPRAIGATSAAEHAVRGASPRR
ncbi:hypothetical protein [Actinophytocola sp.]|uniref:GNAT family N-acetyltransferase n=1 Tax=Actinophytocola sp. TaxID=1872138 RepID=UPI0025BCBE75|nr:hypothetical protein [Actinophytocola sp.]